MKKFLSRPHIWCFTTYFAEGLPYTIIRMVSSVFFRDKGASLESIGLTSFYSLPWVLKFFWAPLVDRFGSKRVWMLGFQFILAATFLVAAFVSPAVNSVTIIAVIFLAGSFLAATHDTAIDGYYMEALDKEGQARFIGYRVMAYRIAMMTGSGVVVTVGATWGWSWGFHLASGLLFLLLVYHVLYLPHLSGKEPLSNLLRFFLSWRTVLGAGFVSIIIFGIWQFSTSQAFLSIKKSSLFFKDFNFSTWVSVGLALTLTLLATQKKHAQKWLHGNPDSFYSKAFLSFLDREKIGLILAFVILMRTGEFLLSIMSAPFMVDLGLKMHYGWISGGIGLPCSITGAIVGGFFISRYNLRKVTFPVLLAQNCTNLIYMALAFALAGFLNSTQTTGLHTQGIVWVAVVHGIDQFAGGLGTAVLTAFIMRLCNKEYKAAHFAIGTGLMNISGIFTGVASGYLASRLGYGWFFGTSFLLSIPGMILAIPVLRGGVSGKESS